MLAPTVGREILLRREGRARSVLAPTDADGGFCDANKSGTVNPARRLVVNQSADLVYVVVPYNSSLLSPPPNRSIAKSLYRSIAKSLNSAQITRP